MNRPIAVFDSGVGGFTVVKDIMRLLPRETIVYVGDTARAPYGNRTAAEILQFSKEICHYLMQYNPKLIVVACNTATAIALESLKTIVNIPIIGVIESGAKAAIQVSKRGKIGVIGTEATVKSKAYELEIKQISKEIEVISYACPRFVPLVEQGQYETEEAFNIVNEQLKNLKKMDIDSLILGCTHYPFLRRMIQRAIGPQVKLIHSGYETAKLVKEILLTTGLGCNTQTLITQESHTFVCTGEIDMFKLIGKEWLLHQLLGRSCVWKSIQTITI